MNDDAKEFVLIADERIPTRERMYTSRPLAGFFTGLTRAVPPLLVIVLLIAIWWIVVTKSDSPIFPTPLQVVTGAWELVQDGTLGQHIEASLLRVGIGL